MRIAQEEVFEPVLSVLKFKDESDAVRIGNDIRFGLAAGAWAAFPARPTWAGYPVSSRRQSHTSA